METEGQDSGRRGRGRGTPKSKGKRSGQIIARERRIDVFGGL